MHPRFSGFTLIELIVVMSVIGVLSSTIFSIINPLEQFARARDTTKLSFTT